MFCDLSLSDEAVVDDGEGLVLGARPLSYRDEHHSVNGIAKGVRFGTLLELKIWLKDYSVKYFRPFTVVHSDVKKRYTVRCEDNRCPWKVCARPGKGGPSWRITSCVPTHMCRGKKVDRKGKGKEEAHFEHRQLTSEFIAYQLSNLISSLPTVSVKQVQDLVFALYHLKVK